MSLRRVVFVANAVLLGTITGCTVYPTLEAPRVMDFAAPSSAIRADQTRPLSLRVDTPYASDPLGTNRILAKPTPLEFQIYPSVRWRDAAPVVMRDLLVETFRHSQGFSSVISDTNPANADWTLVSELTAFHTEYQTEDIQAVIELHGQLVDNQSRKTLCATSFKVQERSESEAIEQVVEAFSRAGQELSESVVRWAGECHQPKP
ncbi:ABC-type transport auxiliary lipoprotein family protein [Marinobacter similis]|uniref:ABC-type transport auxiliary lipoprotein family protein n=1 Tax=Marinobacter similis TaxID=1420916 RepID=UPI0011DDAA2C|nr:ABC-type transport auxiliary lipoprotein family protein [Marinobacter similis]